MNRWRIERILVATDFLESSRLSLDYAVAIAHHFRATVVLLHVVELSQPAMEAEMETKRPSLTRKVAQHRLNALAASVQRVDVAVERHVVEGIPADVIVRQADTLRADLLVMGVHGVHRGLEHLLIGSNTEKILLSAPCPTLTVGAHVLAGVSLGFHPNEILYFSDFTPEATAAAPYALQLAREFHVPVDVCQLIPEVAEKNKRLREELAREYCEEMRRVLGADPPEWSDPPFQLDRGMELDEILARAESQIAELIVLGVHEESLLRRHFHTSFAYQLLARATCPVLTVRAVA